MVQQPPGQHQNSEATPDFSFWEEKGTNHPVLGHRMRPKNGPILPQDGPILSKHGRILQMKHKVIQKKIRQKLRNMCDVVQLVTWVIINYAALRCQRQSD